MRLKNVLTLTAAALVAATPVVAQADIARTAAPVNAENDLGGSDRTSQLLVLALVAGVIAGLIAITDDEPASA